MKTKTLDIVVPVLDEADNLPLLLDRLEAALCDLPQIEWSLTLVDDGSTDASWEVIEGLAEKRPCVRGLRLSRNYGHQHALLAGLEHSEADAVVTMDADLQHPPELIPSLIEEWENGAKIVNTQRKDPTEWSTLKRWSSALYYRVFSFLSGVAIRPGMADFRLLDRQVVDSIRQFREQTLFLRGLVQIVGFKEAVILYQGEVRHAGQTKYTLGRMLRFAGAGVFSFSLMPLRIATVIGVLTSLLAFAELIYVVYIRLFTDRSVVGWASGLALISLMFGIQFILLGIIGEYLGNVLVETRGRPRYLIMQTTVPSQPDVTAEPGTDTSDR